MLLSSRLRRRRTQIQYQGALAMGPAPEGATLNSIGVTYPYDQAFNQYQKALVIYREVGDRAGEAYTLNNIGAEYESHGQYDQALHQYQLALVIARDIGDKVLVEAVLSNIQSLANTN